jgi:hypothetical protein
MRGRDVLIMQEDCKDFDQSELWKEEAGVDGVSSQWVFLPFVDLKMAPSHFKL